MQTVFSSRSLILALEIFFHIEINQEHGCNCSVADSCHHTPSSLGRRKPCRPVEQAYAQLYEFASLFLAICRFAKQNRDIY